jgi:hypothetical protein
MAFPRQEILEKILKRLAEVMRLQDWDIELQLLTLGDLSKTYGVEAQTLRGDCTRDLKHNEAIINLNIDYDPSDKMGKDSENWWYKTLVHELHHITTARYERYAVEAVSHLDSQSLIDNTNENMLIEYENITSTFAKVFTSVYPLWKCLEDANLSWEDIK